MKTRTPKDITDYQKHYSDNGLFKKIGSTFRKAGLKVIYHVLLLYYVLKDENTPVRHKMIIIGALGYFILPTDLVLDLIPMVGYTDDLAALLIALHAVATNITPEIKAKAKAKLGEWFDNYNEKKIDKVI